MGDCHFGYITNWKKKKKKKPYGGGRIKFIFAVFPSVEGFWWTYFFGYRWAYAAFCVFANCTLPNSRGNIPRSAFRNCQLNRTAPGRQSQIAHSAVLFCQVAKSTSPLWTARMSFKLPTNLKNSKG